MSEVTVGIHEVIVDGKPAIVHIIYPSFRRFRQHPGCVMISTSHYVFSRKTGVQIVDQPPFGFSSSSAAKDWLALYLRTHSRDLGQFYTRAQQLIVAPAWAAVDTYGRPIKKP